MKKFMTTKLVEVEEMSRLEYVQSRGWTLPHDEAHLKDERVYKVVYPDGYTSMCPKDKFLEQAIPVLENDKIDNELVKEWMKDYVVITDHPFGKPTTTVHLRLPTGAILTDSTTCVDPKNYSEEIGARILLGRLEEKVWFTLGMMLQAAKYGVGGKE